MSLRLGSCVKCLHKLARALKSLDIAIDMFAGIERAAVFAVKEVKLAQMTDRNLIARLRRGVWKVGAVFEKLLYLAKYPGAALCASTDHQRVDAGVMEHLLCSLG